MSNLTEEQIQAIQVNAAALAQLSDTQIIMLALQEIIYLLEVPPGKKFPLLAALQTRAGVK